ncbi:MAG: hypothetical protein ACRERV_15595 [Methylococcales bacterium]
MQDRVNGTDLYRQRHDRLARTGYNLGRVDSFLIQSLAAATHSGGLRLWRFCRDVLRCSSWGQTPGLLKRKKPADTKFQLPYFSGVSRTERPWAEPPRTPSPVRGIARSPDALAAAGDKKIENAPPASIKSPRLEIAASRRAGLNQISIPVSKTDNTI